MKNLISREELRFEIRCKDSNKYQVCQWLKCLKIRAVIICLYGF